MLLEPEKLTQMNTERNEGKGCNVTSIMQDIQQETILAPRGLLYE